MLKIVKYKGCKRCGGDLFLDRDSEGISLSCLQCGFMIASHDNIRGPLNLLKRRKSATH